MWLGRFLFCIGWAQPILDFIFWAHMIKPVYFVKPFDPTAAVALIVITAVIGYIFGFVGAIIWNRLHRKSNCARPQAPCARQLAE